jgi:sugar lactone lactonase YvrE
MRRFLTLLALLVALGVHAQSDPPTLPYVAAQDPFRLPDGITFGPVASVAINSTGNIFVFNRGPHPLMEFQPDGRFSRFLAEGLIQRAHGLRVDRDDNIWITDVAAHVVFKLNSQGRVMLVLGAQGATGDFNKAFKFPLFSEPTDVAFGPSGEIYVSEGHGGAVARVRKFNKDGNLVKAWGQKGEKPGEFSLAHSIVVDRNGLVYVSDRENGRIQIFDADGNYLKSWTSIGNPNGLGIGRDGFLYVTDGNAGKVFKVDFEGRVLGAIGSLGKANGQFGEAHWVDLDGQRNIYIGDVFNWRVQKFSPAK